VKRALASSCLLALFAAGCGGDGESAPLLPPITVTPAVTVSATPTVSSYPNTPQGAAAFARFVYGEIDRAFQSKDPEILRPLFQAGCSACQNFVKSLEKVKSEGFTVEGRAARVISAESPSSSPPVVVARLAYGGVTFRDVTGRVVATEPASELQDEMTLARVGTDWKVSKIVRVTA
jgi:hypothetical protein